MKRDSYYKLLNLLPDASEAEVLAKLNDKKKIGKESLGSSEDPKIRKRLTCFLTLSEF